MTAAIEPLQQDIGDEVIQWVTFLLADEVYGINVMSVQEVLRDIEITPVPGTPDYILGIVNLRGKLVTVLDTRRRFGLPPRESDDATRIIIVELGEDVLGMLVDSVAEVVYLRESEIDSAPDIGSRNGSRYVRGVYSRDDNLLILIELEQLLTDDRQRPVMPG